MPADFQSTAQALSIPMSPSDASPSPSPTTTPGPVPPWVRRDRGNSNTSTNARRRLSTPYSRNSGSAAAADRTLGARIMRTVTDLLNTSLRLFLRLTPLQRAALVVANVAMLALAVVFLAYSHRFFAWLETVAEGWRALPGGWVLVWLLTFATAFPPMIGYSSTLTVAGFVYGFPGGWFIVASATVAGSGVAFLTSRTVFSRYVNSLVGTDKRFLALGQVLRHDGLWMLAGIRFCPLPYSFSNGFLATIPSISPLSFLLATALATPKLLIHVFIGSRLSQLAEKGDEMTLGDKAINYISMILGGLFGTVIGLVVYRRTMARAEKLAREEAAANGGTVDSEGELDYEDLEEGVFGRSRSRQGEADAAALMDDDDISLWEADDLDSGYRDSEGRGATHKDTNRGVNR